MIRKQFLFFSDGCRRQDGVFVGGGETWAMPNCELGICAKSLGKGWEVATERYFFEIQVLNIIQVLDIFNIEVIFSIPI